MSPVPLGPEGGRGACPYRPFRVLSVPAGLRPEIGFSKMARVTCALPLRRKLWNVKRAKARIRIPLTLYRPNSGPFSWRFGRRRNVLTNSLQNAKQALTFPVYNLPGLVASGLKAGA